MSDVQTNRSLSIRFIPYFSDATIYVGGLDEKVNESLLWELFVQGGPVVNVHMPKDRVTMMHQGKQLLVFIFLVYSFLMAFIKVHTYLHIFREDHKICELPLLVLMFEKKEGDFSKHLWPSNRTSTTQLVCIKLIALKIVSIYQKHIYPCIL